MPMNLPNTPQLVATDCFSGNAFAPNENLVHLFFQTPQIYSYSNGDKAVWMPKLIARQNMTALQANSGLILFTSKLTEFLQNSIFTYRKYSKQCSPVFNSRHNNDTLLTILLPYAHDTLGCHSSESYKFPDFHWTLNNFHWPFINEKQSTFSFTLGFLASLW